MSLGGVGAVKKYEYSGISTSQELVRFREGGVENSSQFSSWGHGRHNGAFTEVRPSQDTIYIRA